MTIKFLNYGGTMDWNGDPDVDARIDECFEACVSCFIVLREFAEHTESFSTVADWTILHEPVQLARYASRQCEVTFRLLRTNDSQTGRALQEALAQCYAACELFRLRSRHIPAETGPNILGDCALLSEECAIACDELSEEWFGVAALEATL
jgi:hypothetical protein